MDKGVDVLAQHQDSSATQIAAAERGAASIGYDLEPEDKAEGYMTAPIFNWGTYYIDTVTKVMDGTWKAESYWGPMKDGVVDLALLTEFAPEGAQEAVDAAKEQIFDGSLQIFAGPLRDQAGQVRVNEGEVMTDDQVWQMNWFLEGVIGNIN